MKATNRRGFLARIFAGAIAAPAVTKLIENGVTKAPIKFSDQFCYGWSGDMEGCTGVTGVLDGGGGTLPYTPGDSVWVADTFGAHLERRPGS